MKQPYRMGNQCQQGVLQQQQLIVLLGFNLWSHEVGFILTDYAQIPKSRLFFDFRASQHTNHFPKFPSFSIVILTGRPLKHNIPTGHQESFWHIPFRSKTIFRDSGTLKGKWPQTSLKFMQKWSSRLPPLVWLSVSAAPTASHSSSPPALPMELVWTATTTCTCTGWASQYTRRFLLLITWQTAKPEHRETYSY